MSETFGREDLNYFFNHVYKDRGIQKWRGMFLSEHTSELAKEEKRTEEVPRLPQQSQKEIEYYLERSMQHNKVLSIQLNELNDFGSTKHHVEGVFRGFVDLDTVMINEEYIQFADIRHIQMKDFQKWSDANEQPFEEIELSFSDEETQFIDDFCDDYYDDFYESEE